MDLELTSCPYRTLCPGCPGDDPPVIAWIPTKGFRQSPEGITCLDWSITIPANVLLDLVTTEGRHLASVDSADKIDANWKKWNRSQKRKESQKRYDNSEKGKKTRAKHVDSERYRLQQQKFRFSEKGEQTYKASQERQKLLRGAAKWLKIHPDRTFNDYLVYLEEMQNNA